MTSARTRAVARTRRLNAMVVAGAVFATVGIGSALVGNAVAEDQQTSTSTGGSGSSSTTSSTEQSPVKRFFSGLVGGSSRGSTNAPSHATTSGS